MSNSAGLGAFHIIASDEFMAAPASRNTQNLLLARLPERDFELMRPHLEHVRLPRRTFLHKRNRKIDFVYFLDTGIASVVADDPSSRSVEVGLIGCEGMSGLAVVLGADRSPYDTYMQIGGAGWRMPAAALREAMEKSKSLRVRLLKFAHVFNVQTAQTALSNGRAKLEERLSRWLLMAHDRIEGDELPLTHALLATMLGVHRSGVTVALGLLERTGFIEIRRGAIVLVDRAGLERNTDGGYGVAEAEMRRVLG